MKAIRPVSIGKIMRIASLSATTLLLGMAVVSAADKKPNVLFIAVDDLRPQLKAYSGPDNVGYGNEMMKTPNMDKLASQGMLFQRHFVQAPTCGASRYLMLTGRREHVTGNNVIASNMKNLPVPESMPHHFRMNGYRTVSIGKIGHSPDGKLYAYDGTGAGEPEMPRSWDEAFLTYGDWKYGWGAFFGYAYGKSREGDNQMTPNSKIFEAEDVPDEGYPDGLIARDAVEKLKELKDSTFFLAVGFFKPHLPFSAPKKYWDMYDRDKLPLAQARLPGDVNYTETQGYDFKGLTGDAKERYIRHGYYATVSYVDAQVGKVIQALDSLGLGDNTIVVLWGDHGWHLGDRNRYAKHTLYEWAVRSAFMMRVPGMASGVTRGLTESIDIYPTLTDLTGLSTPNTVAGQSFAHLLKNPNLPGKDQAFSYWNEGSVAMRTDRYRIIKRGTNVELFDHAVDPGEVHDVYGEHKALADSLLVLLNANSPAYPRIMGCMDPKYLEYDSTATVDDGTCSNLAPATVAKPISDRKAPFTTYSDRARALVIHPGFAGPDGFEIFDATGRSLMRPVFLEE